MGDTPLLAAVIYTVALLVKMNNLSIYDYFLDIIHTTAKWPPNTPLEKTAVHKPSYISQTK